MKKKDEGSDCVFLDGAGFDCLDGQGAGAGGFV
jgi:hypothetical protein